MVNAPIYSDAAAEILYAKEVCTLYIKREDLTHSFIMDFQVKIGSFRT